MTLQVLLSIHTVDKRMESRKKTSLPESTVSFGMDGRTPEVAEGTATAADSATVLLWVSSSSTILCSFRLAISDVTRIHLSVDTVLYMTRVALGGRFNVMLHELLFTRLRPKYCYTQPANHSSAF